MSKFVVAPHFRLQEWVAEEKDYFAAEGLDYEFRETMDSTTGGGHQLGNKVGAYQTLRSRAHLQCQRRLPLDRERRRLERPRQALRRLLFGRALRRVRAGQTRR